MLVELDDLELEALAFEVGRIANRTNVNQRARQERADIVDLDRETAFDAAIDDAFDDLTVFERLLEIDPGARANCFFARQLGLAKAVFNGIQRDFDLIADRDAAFDLCRS